MTVKIPGLEEKLAIARLKQGDLDGMEALVKRHQVRAVSAAFLIVRDPKLAEDIVQEAFLRIAEKSINLMKTDPLDHGSFAV